MLNINGNVNFFGPIQIQINGGNDFNFNHQNIIDYSRNPDINYLLPLRDILDNEYRIIKPNRNPIIYEDSFCCENLEKDIIREKFENQQNFLDMYFQKLMKKLEIIEKKMNNFYFNDNYDFHLKRINDERSTLDILNNNNRKRQHSSFFINSGIKIIEGNREYDNYNINNNFKRRIGYNRRKKYKSKPRININIANNFYPKNDFLISEEQRGKEYGGKHKLEKIERVCRFRDQKHFKIKYDIELRNSNKKSRVKINSQIPYDNYRIYTINEDKERTERNLNTNNCYNNFISSESEENMDE